MCTTNKLYFWLCSNPRKYDFEIRANYFLNLPKDVSYVSLSSKLHVSDSRMRKASPISLGMMTDQFLLDFRQFVQFVPAFSSEERLPILTGLDRGIVGRNLTIP
jgi:hypothetical protein